MTKIDAVVLCVVVLDAVVMALISTVGLLVADTILMAITGLVMLVGVISFTSREAIQLWFLVH